MARKIKQKIIQTTLFGEDEFKTIRSKPMEYDAYIQGARDMLFRCLYTSSQKHQQMIRHLPRVYMKAMVEHILRDTDSLKVLLSGERFTFKSIITPDGKKKTVCDKIKRYNPK